MEVLGAITHNTSDDNYIFVRTWFKNVGNKTLILTILFIEPQIMKQESFDVFILYLIEETSSSNEKVYVRPYRHYFVCHKVVIINILKFAVLSQTPNTTIT